MFLTSACWRGYVVPTGEVGQQYSAPAIQGRISALDGDRMTVQPDDQGRGATVVTLTDSTRLLKARDGLVLRPELMPGHKVRVWYDSPKQAEEPGPHVAAAVMLASLDPKDEWPAP
jgi:hypothetical protein